ncbi:CopG family ribbon-helix-helix protein [Fonticella tunisiensis]|uniref:CopG family transcriptional regulator/antitoxin EndoAI n=1 Tax=Fonticella tunisiensis TaxID=1096341 RepID=A0A4R7KVX0_9CLOT|nr:ribbon-helix-helix protein, CopG family [Fonticella tunisiensis]TDT63701.1 CopG family transcriptional regulator/antitoxin EndoAI [Fonticella tunisiensis]
MAENKKIVVSLPKSLLEEFDNVLDCKNSKNRSQFIREAVILYIKERKKKNMRELMKRGYEEMAEINSEIAECSIACESAELAKYEAVLAESDFIDGAGGEKRRYILC